MSAPSTILPDAVVRDCSRTCAVPPRPLLEQLSFVQCPVFCPVDERCDASRPLCGSQNTWEKSALCSYCLVRENSDVFFRASLLVVSHSRYCVSALSWHVELLLLYCNRWFINALRYFADLHCVFATSYMCCCAAYPTSDVLQNWEKYTVRQDGDAIRRLIGTIGVSSPLSSVRKAFVSIRDAEEDSVRVLARG